MCPSAKHLVVLCIWRVSPFYEGVGTSHSGPDVFGMAHRMLMKAQEEDPCFDLLDEYPGALCHFASIIGWKEL